MNRTGSGPRGERAAFRTSCGSRSVSRALTGDGETRDHPRAPWPARRCPDWICRGENSGGVPYSGVLSDRKSQRGKQEPGKGTEPRFPCLGTAGLARCVLLGRGLGLSGASLRL